MCHMKEQHPAFLACMAPSKSVPAPWLKKTPTRCLIPMVRAVDCFCSAQDATTGGISNACAIGPCGFCFLGFYGATVAWCNAWAQETADSLRASDDQGCPRLLQLAGGHDHCDCFFCFFNLMIWLGFRVRKDVHWINQDIIFVYF